MGRTGVMPATLVRESGQDGEGEAAARITLRLDLLRCRTSQIRVVARRGSSDAMAALIGLLVERVCSEAMGLQRDDVDLDDGRSIGITPVRWRQSQRCRQ
ncbi:hypothetical protein J2R96_001965 [Bradyrhizobium elkanii]|nr:hypothetical protein [Bradyrhizobium elkanii]